MPDAAAPSTAARTRDRVGRTALLDGAACAPGFVVRIDETTNRRTDMKTYTVLYAEDVPHYGTAEIEAENDAEAIAKASAISDEDLGSTANDPEFCSSVCKRIVHIQDADGNDVAHDLALDAYTLIHGEDKRRACEAAPALLKALETIAAIPLWGEPLADQALKDDFIHSGEYDTQENEFTPSGDTESTYLRDAVETAREALKTLRGQPSGASAQEAEQ
jgi:hypothetical protein